MSERRIDVTMMPPCDVFGCDNTAARLNKGDNADPLALCNKHQLYVTREIQKDIGQVYRHATGVRNDAFTMMLGLPDLPELPIEGEVAEPKKPKAKKLKKGSAKK